MNPSNLVTWAIYIGIAWLLFACLTGADEWLKSLFGKSKIGDLEKRIEELEERQDELDNKLKGATKD